MPLAVGGVEGVGDFDGEREDGLGFERTAADLVFQRDAFEELHGNERLAILFADVVDRADVGMVQRGRRLRFALKAGKSLRVAGNIFGQKLKRDESVQACVLRFVDHAHATSAKFLDDLIVGDDPVDHERSVCFCSRFILWTSRS